MHQHFVCVRSREIIGAVVTPVRPLVAISNGTAGGSSDGM